MDFDEKFDRISEFYRVFSPSEIRKQIKKNENIFEYLEEIKPYLKEYFSEAEFYLDMNFEPEANDDFIILHICVNSNRFNENIGDEIRLLESEIWDIEKRLGIGRDVLIIPDILEDYHLKLKKLILPNSFNIIVMIGNISDKFTYDCRDGKVKLSVNEVSTGWLGEEDSFLKRLENLKANPVFLDEHLAMEIEMKNILDEGISQKRPSRAIELFDKVIYYDENYAEALIGKSHALREEKHFVKSLRYYKKAVRADESLKDSDYYRMLLGEANRERDSFPKLKLNIYAGDEHFTKGEYEQALKSYAKALKDKTRFKDKILFKLLNKTGTAYLKLGDFENALKCFTQSLDLFENDYACFGCGICQYELGRDVSDEFKKALNLSKRQQLRQVLVLNELGFFSESLAIVDELLRMHFTPDTLYFRLINAKRYALTELGADVSEFDEIFEKLSLK